MRTIGGAALGAARRLDLEVGEIREIQQQQFAVELAGHPQENLDRQQRLQRTHGPGNRTQDPRFGTVAHHAVRDGIGPKAAQAGVALLRLVDLQLAFVLIDAGEDRRPLREYGGVVDQVLGAKIVAAIDHDVVAVYQRESVVAIEPRGMQFDLYGGVDSLDRRQRQLNFSFTDIRQGED